MTETMNKDEGKRVNGVVEWFNADRGYGFIVIPGTPEEQFFVHYSYIQEMDGYRKLEKGQNVSFTLVDTPKGVQACEVLIEE
jgi:CspA family cold shock protein